MIPARPFLFAAGVAAALSACGIGLPWSDAFDCSLRPVGDDGAGLRIGPSQAVATSCGIQVEVEGRIYSVGVGRWLDEDAVVLTEYAPITRAVGPVSKPVTFSIEGVDPREMLVMEGAEGDVDDLEPMGPYMILWGSAGRMPVGMCAYADPLDVQYPGDTCPLQEGRTYGAEMIVECGLGVPMGLYGGQYWQVVDPAADPPAGSQFPGMSVGLDYGTVELLDDGALLYVSELGAELTLERTDDPDAAAKTCPRPDGY